MLWGEVNAEKKIGTTESDVLSENPKMKNRVTGCVPECRKPPQRLPHPGNGSQTLDTDKHAPFPFNKPSVSGLVTACWRAYWYICVCVYLLARTSRIPRRATRALGNTENFERDAHEKRISQKILFSAILAIRAK